MLTRESVMGESAEQYVSELTADRLHSKGTREGFGLWSIDHRLGQFGGFTEIESGDGLTVRIALPVKLLDH